MANDESEYSNREIDEKFGNIIVLLERIETQTTRTNGRVSSLENWRWFMIGGMSIISLMVIPMGVYIVFHL